MIPTGSQGRTPFALPCSPATWPGPARHTTSRPFAGAPSAANAHNTVALHSPHILPYRGQYFLSCSDMIPSYHFYLLLRPQDCLALLQQLAVDPALRGSPPFTLPPLTPYTLSSLPDTTCLEPNTVLGPRFGGECVKCGTYGVKEVRRCGGVHTVC